MALPARLSWSHPARVSPRPPISGFCVLFEMQESFDPVLHATLNTSRWQNLPPIRLVVSHTHLTFVGTLELNGRVFGTLYEALPGGKLREVGGFEMTMSQQRQVFDGTGSKLIVDLLFGPHTTSITKAGHGPKKGVERSAFWDFRADLSLTVEDSSEPLADFQLEEVDLSVFPDLLEVEGEGAAFLAGEDLQTLFSLAAPTATHDGSFTFQTDEFVWRSNRQRSREENKWQIVQGGTNAPY